MHKAIVASMLSLTSLSLTRCCSVIRLCRRLGAGVSLDTPIAVMKMCAVKKVSAASKPPLLRFPRCPLISHLH